MPDLDYQALFEATPSLLLILDPHFCILDANQAFLRDTMSQRDRLIGRHVFDAFPDNPYDPDATAVLNLRASLERVLQTREPDSMAIQRYDIQTRNGYEVRYWSAVNLPVFDSSGTLVYIIHRVQNVTDFVRLKEALRSQSELTEAERTRAESMASEVVTRSEQLGSAHRQLRVAYEGLADLYREVASLVAVAETELNLPELNPARSQSTDPEDLVRTIKRLIAGHKRLEIEFRQAQKMEAVGRLAGGIAHDFNNLLTVILGYCKILLARVPPGNLIHRQLNDIRIAGERAAELTRQLLIFSRKQVLEPRTVNLASTLEEMDRMFHRIIGADVEIATLIDANAGQVQIDPTQIQQVLMNLVINARDAMPTGGKLTLELRKQTVPEGVASPFPVPPGDYVVLTVTDTGIGMSPEVKQRAFEPFFTTKDPGSGTGLGLSTVYGIVKQSGGFLYLYSEPGVGTSFRIFLPRIAENPDLPRELSQPTPCSTGTETILVVEDDDLIRSLVLEILGEHGYNVMGASRGDEALFICQQIDGPIDLLVTDMILPRMSGTEIAEQVRQVRPGIRVLYMSGYTGDSVPHSDFISDPQTQFVQKPFTQEILCQRVRAALDAPLAAGQ